MIVCPNTSPVLVLARIDRLDLLGEAARVVVSRAVLREVQDKLDAATRRIDALVGPGSASLVDPAPSERVDPMRNLGPGERSVLAFALESRDPVLCVLDDAAARAEARRLGLRFTGIRSGSFFARRSRGRSTAPVSWWAPLSKQASTSTTPS